MLHRLDGFTITPLLTNRALVFPASLLFSPYVWTVHSQKQVSLSPLWESGRGGWGVKDWYSNNYYNDHTYKNNKPNNHNNTFLI